MRRGERDCINPDWLRRLYGEGVSAYDLAWQSNCAPETIYRWLRRLGIPLKKKFKHPSGDFLRQQYVVEHKTSEQIAAIIGCSRRVVSRLIKSAGIRPRRTGPKNGVKFCQSHRDRIAESLRRFWQPRRLGDRNERDRDAWEYRAWKKAVFDRDGHRCVFCGSNRHLQADHIKPFHSNPLLRFVIKNGRTLCLGCHSKTPTWGRIEPQLPLPFRGTFNAVGV